MDAVSFSTVRNPERGPSHPEIRRVDFVIENERRRQVPSLRAEAFDQYTYPRASYVA